MRVSIAAFVVAATTVLSPAGATLTQPKPCPSHLALTLVFPAVEPVLSSTTVTTAALLKAVLSFLVTTRDGPESYHVSLSDPLKSQSREPALKVAEHANWTYQLAKCPGLKIEDCYEDGTLSRVIPAEGSGSVALAVLALTFFLSLTVTSL